MSCCVDDPTGKHSRSAPREGLPGGKIFHRRTCKAVCELSFDVVCIDKDGYGDRILGILFCHLVHGIEGTGNLLTSSDDSSGVEGTGNPRRKHSKRSC